MEHVIPQRARIMRDILESYARNGTQIACVPAKTREFVAVCDAALRIPGGPIPLLVIDWQGEGDAPSNSDRVEHRVEETARDRVCVAG